MNTKTARAVRRKMTAAVTNDPHTMTEPLISQLSALKSGSPKGMATSGMITSATMELTTRWNATPMMKPTANMSTLPLMTNSFNSCSMGPDNTDAEIDQRP